MLNEAQQQEMVKVLKALANPIRLRMIASLQGEPKNAYALAKELRISYPLAHLHLKGLRKLGLVREVREVRRAEGMPSIKYYAPSDFELVLTPERIREVFRNESGGEEND